MPAAAAADSTSRFRASFIRERNIGIESKHTFITINIAKKFHKQVCAATCNMNKWSFFSKPHPRRNSETLSESVVVLNQNHTILPIQVT